MQLVTRSLAVALLASIALAGAASAGSLHLNPQLAITATNQQTDSQVQVSDKAKVGWMLGANVRMGSMPYFSPGIYFQKTALEVTGLDSLGVSDITDVIGATSVYVPLKVGVVLAGLRIFAGPSLTIMTGVDSNDFGITKDDYKDTHTGLEAGLGFNIAIVTLDASYEKGLSDVYTQTSTKQDVFRFLAGVQF
jgi:outer membrane protein with beta-barrel domain